MALYHRESLADYESKVLALYEAAGTDVEELSLLASGLHLDRENYLNEKKMGRVRLVNHWIETVEDRVISLKEEQFISMPTLGIF